MACRRVVVDSFGWLGSMERGNHKSCAASFPAAACCCGRFRGGEDPVGLPFVRLSSPSFIFSDLDVGAVLLDGVAGAAFGCDRGRAGERKDQIDESDS